MSSIDDSENEGLQLAGAKDSIYGDREQAEVTQDSLDEQELSLDNEIREEQQKLNEERERLSRRRTQSTTGPWDLNETMVRAIASREGSPEPVGWTQITDQTAIQPAESKTMIRENWNNCGKDDLTSPKMPVFNQQLDKEANLQAIAVQHNIAVEPPIMNTRISHPPLGIGNRINPPIQSLAFPEIADNRTERQYQVWNPAMVPNTPCWSPRPYWSAPMAPVKAALDFNNVSNSYDRAPAGAVSYMINERSGDWAYREPLTEQSESQRLQPPSGPMPTREANHWSTPVEIQAIQQQQLSGPYRGSNAEPREEQRRTPTEHLAPELVQRTPETSVQYRTPEEFEVPPRQESSQPTNISPHQARESAMYNYPSQCFVSNTQNEGGARNVTFENPPEARPSYRTPTQLQAPPTTATRGPPAGRQTTGTKVQPPANEGGSRRVNFEQMPLSRPREETPLQLYHAPNYSATQRGGDVAKMSRKPECLVNSDGWAAFKDSFISYMKLQGASEEVWIGVMMTFMSPELQQRIRALNLTRAELMSPESCLEKIDEVMEPSCSKLGFRIKLSSVVQGDRSLLQFANEIRGMAKGCNFGKGEGGRRAQDAAMLSSLICGIRDQDVAYEILKADVEDFDKGLKIASAIESAKAAREQTGHTIRQDVLYEIQASRQGREETAMLIDNQTKIIEELKTKLHNLLQETKEGKGVTNFRGEGAANFKRSVPTCYHCNMKGHIRPDCPIRQKEVKVRDRARDDQMGQRKWTTDNRNQAQGFPQRPSQDARF